jgi:lipoteichoic acid synthase
VGSEDTSSQRRPGMFDPSPGTRPRNVILIVLESVGTRYLSLYGSKVDTTPRLVTEQGNALVFDRYYAPVAWTAYSLISLATSRRPKMEVYNTLFFGASSSEGGSLATVLKEHGYRTAFMAAGDLDWASQGLLQRNGFNEVQRMEDVPATKTISSWGAQDLSLFDGISKWIGKRGSQPFFLMAWTGQTHHPYKLAPGQEQIELLPPDMKTKEKNDLGRYVSLIREVDTLIGRLLDHLRTSGLADDTLVVVTGDHGEAFGRLHHVSGHGFTVYDEEVRAPLFLWNPRLFPRGGHSDVIGSQTDLAPTLLDVLGVPQPAGWDGRSLFAAGRPPRTYLFAAAWGSYLLGVREENWKYIYDVRGGQEELYDLAADVDEQKDVAAAQPDRAHRLRQRLAAWLQVERQRTGQREK